MLTGFLLSQTLLPSSYPNATIRKYSKSPLGKLLLPYCLLLSLEFSKWIHEELWHLQVIKISVVCHTLTWNVNRRVHYLYFFICLLWFFFYVLFSVVCVCLEQCFSTFLMGEMGKHEVGWVSRWGQSKRDERRRKIATITVYCTKTLITTLNV